VRNRITYLFYKYFINISLKQLNLLAIWVILVFTIIFSLLLIQEEYKVFEGTIEKEQNIYTMQQYDEIIKMAWRIEALVDFELDRKEKSHLKEVLVHVADVFSEHSYRFVNFYSPDMTTLDAHAGITSEQLGKLDMMGNDVTPGTVYFNGEIHNALLYAKTLHDGYKLVTGIYTQSSDEFLKKRKQEMKHRLIRIILEIVTLAFILFGFVLGINKVFSTLQERDITAFLDFFKLAANKDAVINPHIIFFKEYKTMVDYANTMVTTIAFQKNSLYSLNLSLEDKVKQKTAALEVKNLALEEEKAFSEALQQSQKEFIRYAIHETNTPLSVIVANIELYNMKFGKDRYLSKIEASVKNIFNIYDDLGYLVKKDQVEYPKKLLDFDAFLKSRVDFFTEVAEQAGITFVYTSSCRGVQILFNETKLQRIVDNNLSNAIKYTYQNEEVHVLLEATETTCRFSIASHSQLIEDTEKIFEPFYRERSSEKGFGLGLNLVKSICDEEGIKISLYSDENETKFSYTFMRV